jgi:hypothetical protein
MPASVHRLRPHLSLIAWEQDQDLRYISQNMDRLDEWVKRYRLKSGKGILFSNTPMNRFRIIAVLGDMPVLLVPPVASSGEFLLSIFLRVSIFVRSLSPSSDVGNSLDVHIESTKKRIISLKKLRQRRARMKRSAA